MNTGKSFNMFDLIKNYDYNDVYYIVPKTNTSLFIY